MKHGSHVALNISEDKTCSKDNNHYTKKMLSHPIVYSNAMISVETFKVNGTILIDGKPFDDKSLPGSTVFHQLKITSPTLNATYEGIRCYEKEGDGLIFKDCEI